LKNRIKDSHQVISSEWIERSTSVYYNAGWYDYGYLWWTIPDAGVYEATGHYEQKIYVIAEHDIVVVFTGDVPDNAYHPTDYFVMIYVIPSLIQRSSDYIFSLVVIDFTAIITMPLIIAYWKYRVMLKHTD
jgi:CubicO group peptidase (beta-lactamase class C family)